MQSIYVNDNIPSEPNCVPGLGLELGPILAPGSKPNFHQEESKNVVQCSITFVSKRLIMINQTISKPKSIAPGSLLQTLLSNQSMGILRGMPEER